MHSVTVTGTASLALPNGQTYTPGSIVVLSDDEWQNITQVENDFLTDNGEVIGPYARPSSTTSLTLVDKGDRETVIITNASTAVLYIAYGTTVSPTLYTQALAAGATWNEPQADVILAISGVWASANGNALVTVLPTA